MKIRKLNLFLPYDHYTRGLKFLLKDLDIKVAFNPKSTLRNLSGNLKDKTERIEKFVIYKMTAAKKRSANAEELSKHATATY